MEITWLGHSSFLIKDSKGKKFLTDPFDESIGYNTYKDEVDLVTISHDHFDHSYTESIKNNPEVIDTIGSFSAHGIEIKGIPSYHDNCKGAKRGENTIYIITVDGYTICHLGDLGHKLSKNDLDKIGDIDILLIPVGGNFTIDGKEAAAIAKDINSHIVIPMHFKTPYLTFDLDGVEIFITNMKNAEKVNNCTLKIEGKLEDKNAVKILDPISQ